jgi:predicted DNA-binding WGR domain protein
MNIEDMWLKGIAPRLEFKDGSSNKFWKLEKTRDGSWLATWGKIGTTGQSIGYDSTTAQKKFMEKIAKGYQVVNGAKIKEEVKEESVSKINFMKELEKL